IMERSMRRGVPPHAGGIPALPRVVHSFRPSTFLLAALALTFAIGSASAISRYDSTSMSCASADERVRPEGAVIFRYPSERVRGLQLYDRFVAHRGFCTSGEVTAAKSVPTRSGECALLICRQIIDERDFPFSD